MEYQINDLDENFPELTFDTKREVREPKSDQFFHRSILRSYPKNLVLCLGSEIIIIYYSTF